MFKNSMAEFEETLRSQGVYASLRFLNQRVGHRFTAIFRMDKDKLEIVQLIDKLDDPSTAPISPLPFANSFCELVMPGGALMTADSAADARFAGKFSQGVVVAYVGLPLVQNGHLYGSLCHLDYSEKKVDEKEFAFLQSVMAVLPHYL